MHRRSFLIAAGAASAGAFFTAPPNDAAAQGAAPASLPELSLSDVADRLRRRKVSSVESTRACLDRITVLNPSLNAFITVDPEKSLAQARLADERIGRGEGGPLTGIPVAHKDIFCAQGWLTTCGSKMLANFVAPRYTQFLAQEINSFVGRYNYSSIIQYKFSVHELVATIFKQIMFYFIDCFFIRFF